MEDKHLTDLIPLTKKEVALRDQLEEKVFITVRMFYVELGQTLSEIKAKQLYKSTHHTFADYSREILDLAKRSANQYIAAYGVVKNLSAIADRDGDEVSAIAPTSEGETNWSLIPQNESQARALVGLEPEEQRKSWKTALETAPEGKLTAAHVRSTVRELGFAKIKDQTNPEKRAKKPNSTRMNPEFKAATDTFLKAIQTEIDNRFKDTDRVSLLNELDGIRAAISGAGNHRVPDWGYTLEANNAEKLQVAGFTIYRMDEKALLIEKMVTGSSWDVVDQYKNKRELKKAFDELMLIKTNIQG